MIRRLATIQGDFVRFAKVAKIRDDIKDAKRSRKKSVFLGGMTSDSNRWRQEIKREFGDKFAFIDPYDNNWRPERNIYDECQGMMIADEVVFYRGGPLSRKEQEFLEGVKRKNRNKTFRTFTDLNTLKSYLRNK
jgi:hypothetical protein